MTWEVLGVFWAVDLQVAFRPAPAPQAPQVHPPGRLQGHRFPAGHLQVTPMSPSGHPLVFLRILPGSPPLAHHSRSLPGRPQGSSGNLHVKFKSLPGHSQVAPRSPQVGPNYLQSTFASPQIAPRSQITPRSQDTPLSHPRLPSGHLQVALWSPPDSGHLGATWSCRLVVPSPKVFPRLPPDGGLLGATWGGGLGDSIWRCASRTRVHADSPPACVTCPGCPATSRPLNSRPPPHVIPSILADMQHTATKAIC